MVDSSLDRGTCAPRFCRLIYYQVSPTDVEEGMRVGVDRTKYSVQIPLPPKIDPTVRFCFWGGGGHFLL